MAQFTISRSIKNPGETVYTQIVTVPPNITQAKITLDIDPVALLDPTTNVRVGIQWAHQGIEDWREIGATGVIGRADNPAQMPYTEIDPRSMLLIVGQRVRGFLYSATARDVGAVVTVT